MDTTTPTSYHHFLGIDVSKDTIDCWLRPRGEYSQWTNRDEGFQRLHQWLKGHNCSQQYTLICIEDTGVYSDQISPTPPPKEPVKQLQQLYAERQRIISARSATQNRSQQATHAQVPSALLEEQWQQQLQLYKQQIEQLEKQIHQLITTHQGLNRYYQLLLSIPGIGNVTAWLWLTLFYGQQKLNHKKIASRFGFAPHGHRSGTSVRGRTRSSGHGNSQMRSCMTMVARSVSHHYERFARYKQRKLDEGKPWPIVRNNLINKMIKIICAIWNSGQAFRKDYESRFDRQKNAA
ncbi:transposase [Fodinibius salsisoli]|uniref:IS110 family transposase n=1 Tax=Fodinibius salsisoli TaxID=2820877 RepID=A0ABT3PMV1_9BACT|nr:transposase [Fodinibius salsisoli]MCW9707267.1 IS110 family transposase [Fodinibius salsisoli]